MRHGERQVKMIAAVEFDSSAFTHIWKGPMSENNSVAVELSQREVELLLRYGYPFEEQRVQLEGFANRPGPHRLKVGAYHLSMMIADLIRSAKRIHSDASLEELDALCCVLERAERNERRVRVEN
jgi:hypothetical protein